MEIFIVNTFIYQKFDNLTVFMCQEDTWACGLSFHAQRHKGGVAQKPMFMKVTNCVSKTFLWRYSRKMNFNDSRC